MIFLTIFFFLMFLHNLFMKNHKRNGRIEHHPRFDGYGLRSCFTYLPHSNASFHHNSLISFCVAVILLLHSKKAFKKHEQNIAYNDVENINSFCSFFFLFAYFPTFYLKIKRNKEEDWRKISDFFFYRKEKIEVLEKEKHPKWT